ncbi:hypothetical protein GRT41_33175 [Burkholderia pseudomallei]|nr:hypothetical protein [Burkholderia pseudomallei]MXN60761.1 hypothetical protein [Burkholderia pseudomallei]RAP87124.1 hypothetical protein DPQ99_30920 [Burkholderia pseudomallei]RAP93631.1 hypothetical protein DPQ97_03865 [Burkholderia pseudomallei]RAP95675.1 hypothetical protein DPR01_03865 [Burkholderia pseudomallei]
MAARRWAGTRRSGSGCGERVGRAGSARSGGGRCPVVRCGDWEGGDDSEGGAPMSFVKHYRRLWVGKWCRRAAWRTARRSDAAPAR